MTHETVPIERSLDCKETTKLQVGESKSETSHVWQTAQPIPSYEIKYEPMKVSKDGLCIIEEEGDDSNKVDQHCIPDTPSSTMGSHHSYAIVKERQGEILEMSTESFIDQLQERDMDGRQPHTLDGRTIATGSVGDIGRALAPNIEFRGAKNVMYENLSVSMSPNVRYYVAIHKYYSYTVQAR